MGSGASAILTGKSNTCSDFLKQFRMASSGFDRDTRDVACLPEAAIAEISLLEYGPIDSILV